MADPGMARRGFARYSPAAVYTGLLLIGIPWYWPAHNHAIVFGVPAWVVIAIIVSFMASVYTAWLLRAPWPGERAEDGDDETGGSA